MTEKDLKAFIEEFIQKTSFGFEQVSVSFDQESGLYWCSIQSQDSKRLIGRDGETIQAINFLIKRIIETKYKDGSPTGVPRVIIDVNGYQKEKIERIRAMAFMMAERARFFKSKIEFEPMNSVERRIVHDYISRHDDLLSESVGAGRERRVVISYKEKL